MVSQSSKVLPFVSIGVGVVMAILSIAGFGSQLDNAIALLSFILPITAGGGLVNKALESSVKSKQALLANENLKNVIAEIVQQAEEAKAQARSIKELATKPNS
jgi:hypothetical protein